MILFRRLDDPVPREWEPGLHWQVEYHDDQWDVTYPLGVAWVTACDLCVYLDYVQVADHHRRRGIATALIAACGERWPNIILTDPISEAGAGLLAAVCPDTPEE